RVSYLLKAVVYIGGYHFSTCFVTAAMVWKYDGRQNNGTPICLDQYQPSDLCNIQTLDGRVPSHFIYVLTASAVSIS
ncbi:uncharacterized protein F5891DRAFT_941524, partial [Suillus fuscotomentosus]